MLVWKFNVLEAVNPTVEAWGDIPGSTIVHWWEKTGIHPQMDCQVVAYYEMILRKETQISVASLLNSDADLDYLLHDEDLTTILIPLKCQGM